MKLYLVDGRYYEKQADCPHRKWEVIDLPFNASPKSDFVAWMNSVAEGNCVDDVIVEDEPAETNGLIDTRPRHDGQIERDARHPLTTLSIEEWCEAAEPHQLGTIMRAASLRLQQVAQEVAR